MGLEDDQVRPFLLSATGVRGRIIRLGPALDRILTRHAYPDPIARLLGECLVVTASLASGLKFDGRLILQIAGGGPVRLLVADVDSEGAIRGYASYDDAAFADRPDDDSTLGGLVGGGTLALTIDQGPETDRFQSVVDLSGGTLADSINQYFSQSEQLDTTLKLACSRDAEGRWTGTSIVVQRLPAGELSYDDALEDWRRTVVLLASCTASELLDPALGAQELIYRLFHEERIRFFEARPLRDRCRCEPERFAAVIRSLASADIEDLKEADGRIRVTCQFCKREQAYDDADIERLRAA